MIVIFNIKLKRKALHNFSSNIFYLTKNVFMFTIIPKIFSSFSLKHLQENLVFMLQFHKSQI